MTYKENDVVVSIPVRTKVLRKCKKCSGLIPSGRCPCASVRPHYPPAKEFTVQHAHFYHLIQSIRSGSWAQTGYRSAWSSDREGLREVYDNFGGSGFSLRSRRSTKVRARFDDVLYFVFRCEVATEYDGDEFAKLMAARMTLWLGGYTNQKVMDCLQLSVDRLRELDEIIRGDHRINWPRCHHKQNEAFLKLRRRMKAGVADAILRRRQHGIGKSLASWFERQDPFSSRLDPFAHSKPCWMQAVRVEAEDDLDKKLHELSTEREDNLAYANSFSE